MAAPSPSNFCRDPSFCYAERMMLPPTPNREHPFNGDTLKVLMESEQQYSSSIAPECSATAPPAYPLGKIAAVSLVATLGFAAGGWLLAPAFYAGAGVAGGIGSVAGGVKWFKMRSTGNEKKAELPYLEVLEKRMARVIAMIETSTNRLGEDQRLYQSFLEVLNPLHSDMGEELASLKSSGKKKEE